MARDGGEKERMEKKLPIGLFDELLPVIRINASPCTSDWSCCITDIKRTW